jgi:hypothetical protein
MDQYTTILVFFTHLPKNKKIVRGGFINLIDI